MKLEKLSKGRFIKTSIIVLVVISVVGVIFINKSKAKYRVTQSIQIVNGTVNYKPADFSLISINLQEDKDSSNYTSSGSVPVDGYKLNENKTYCTIGGTKYEGKSAYNGQGITINYNDKNVDFLGFNKANTKCYLYFDLQVGISVSDLLVNIPKNHPNKGTPNFKNTSCSIGCDDTTVGLFTATDDFGTSSYFRGSVDYNWVKFGKVGNADIWWRIVRFNGNNTIRLIYAGTSTTSSAPANTGTGCIIGKSAFNKSNYEQATGVKYMYDANTSSTIKQKLDIWYSQTSNLNETLQSDHIDTETGFCNDTGDSSSTSYHTFPSWDRIYNGYSPTLKCASPNDLFTKSGSKGNNKLTYPIGLITEDEVSYAGSHGDYKMNKKYYLYTDETWWTMTPSNYNMTAEVWYVNNYDGYMYSDVRDELGVRPVINLKADTQFKPGGTGTSTNPYEVVI